MSDLQNNIEKLETYLARFRETGVLNQIGGKACPAASGATFETTSPVDDSLICKVARGDAADIDAAARAAKEAFPAWRDLAATERKKILHKIADGIVARAEEIAFCECWDTGQALRFMSKAALRGAENFRFFADRAPAARDGQMLPSPTLMNVTTRVPIGPVGVIHDVSMDIPTGEFAVFVGPSGCGKSTLLRSLARLQKASSGQVILDGQSIAAQNSKSIARRLAILSQSPVAPEGLTVRDLVLRGRTPHQSAWRQYSVEDAAAVAAAISATGLNGLEERVLDTLSGGQRQRAWIAMALAQEPDLLIADEPTTALDVTIQGQIIDLLKDLNKNNGLSILFISHDLSLVRSFAYRTMVMYAGRIVESGSTKALFSSPKHPYTKALLKVAGLEKENNQFITIDGTVPDPRYYPSGCPFHPRCDVAEDRCSTEFPELIQTDDHSWNCIHK